MTAPVGVVMRSKLTGDSAQRMRGTLSDGHERWAAEKSEGWLLCCL